MRLLGGLGLALSCEGGRIDLHPMSARNPALPREGGNPSEARGPLTTAPCLATPPGSPPARGNSATNGRSD